MLITYWRVCTPANARQKAAKALSKALPILSGAVCEFYLAVMASLVKLPVKWSSSLFTAVAKKLVNYMSVRVLSVKTISGYTLMATCCQR